MFKVNLVDILIHIIRVYQRYFAQFIKGSCIYIPSCSQYSIEAIQTYGAFKGAILAIRRILRCKPSNKGGYDPIM